jgi:hypothetical protein
MVRCTEEMGRIAVLGVYEFFWRIIYRQNET